MGFDPDCLAAKFEACPDIEEALVADAARERAAGGRDVLWPPILPEPMLTTRAVLEATLASLMPLGADASPDFAVFWRDTTAG